MSSGILYLEQGLSLSIVSKRKLNPEIALVSVEDLFTDLNLMLMDLLSLKFKKVSVLKMISSALKTIIIESRMDFNRTGGVIRPSKN